MKNIMSMALSPTTLGGSELAMIKAESWDFMPTA